ncbi:uncharacterized protein BXIN_2808 [Babesia sp. Xinjiang]|uniref:uncharacterized protein n=1 Tax=Babesia sp. Xinjiang TaxID=462227 RepID=UPI000A26402B|nr:uncharacterized protein BXIN_2808 [Babesia sp. Xinjiang]ORM41767.1 hypothetical protein BXIN_2808 [Babesia sp. Xinjiang]
MRSNAAKRIDRMLTFRPMPLNQLKKIEVTYARNNECVSDFVRDLVPLMAYGNKHIVFRTKTVEAEEEEYCALSLNSGSNTTLNLKLYRYPLQILQRILDIAGTEAEDTRNS